MRIPNSVNKLPLRTYIALNRLETAQIDSEFPEEERAEKILSLITGMTIEQIHELPWYKLEYYYLRLAILRGSAPNKRVKKTIWVKGKRYRVTKDEKHLNTNQFTIADTFNYKAIEHANKLAGVVYLRHKLFSKPKFDGDSFNDFCEDLLDCKTGKVIGAVFFYTNKFNLLKRNSLTYSLQSMEKIVERMAEIRERSTNLGINMDGTISSIVSELTARSAKMN